MRHVNLTLNPAPQNAAEAYVAWLLSLASEAINILVDDMTTSE